MRFGAPELFWAFTALPIFVALYIRLMIVRKNSLAKFGEKHLLARLIPKKAFDFRPLKAVLFLVAYSFLVVALTRPKFGLKTEMVERKGVDVMVALDISKSMLAEDIIPNRLKRAKHEIEKLVDLLSGDRFGLVVFAGESFVQTPLTLDYGAAKLFLDAVTTDWISAQGTDLAGAIKQADRSFPKASKAGKVLIVISDGEEQQGDAIAAAKKAATEGMTIYTVGVGSEGGVPIPVKGTGENVKYKKDSEGNLVMTKLNPKLLEEVSILSGGKYFSAGVNLDLTTIYKEISQMEKSDFGMNQQSRYHEQYQLFLLVALILFLLEFFIPDTLKFEQEWRGRFV
jgi:Ca-activated chloride channel homolog